MDIRGMVFDLDGTLVDSLDDITTCLNVALSAFGLNTYRPEWVRQNLGHGARHLTLQALAAQGRDELGAAVVAEFIRYYNEHPVETTVPYPGVRRLLERFHDQGIILAVSSNKPASIVVKVVDTLQLAPFFHDVWGGDSFTEKKPSPLALQHFTAGHNLSSDTVLMVGDSQADIMAARRAGVRSCFFQNGYGTLDPADPPPDYTIAAFVELAACVLPARSSCAR
ncbi:MAG: HAD-IA family hydrolase [Acidobacteria bacterium]|nr:HAD-IA family hydrolase [Acidobacteriota bacterium]